MKTFKTGARREDSLLPRYDLLPTHGVAAVATVMEKGARKYGTRNWEKGIPVNHYVNHAISHLLKYITEQRRHECINYQVIEWDENHLAHAATNILMAIDTLHMIAERKVPDDLRWDEATNND